MLVAKKKINLFNYQRTIIARTSEQTPERYGFAQSSEQQRPIQVEIWLCANMLSTALTVSAQAIKSETIFMRIDFCD